MKLKRWNEFINEASQSYPIEDYYNMIDYTLLDNDASDDDINKLCEKAINYGVKSVCIMPKHVKKAADKLKNSDVLVCTVISFPEGTDTSEEKLDETKKAISDGADEIDMVLNYPLLKKTVDIKDKEMNYSFKYKPIFDDVKILVDECHKNTNKNGDPIVLKVIVESGLLTTQETEIATKICIDAGADFIKTSTGKVSTGAQIDKVKIMSDIIKENRSDMKIKASGGIRTMSDIKKFDNYVDRFGISHTSVDKLSGIEVENNSNY